MRANFEVGHGVQGYRAWFEDNPLPMWVFDPQTCVFLDVNEAAIRHYGYSRDEFLGMTIKDIRPPEDVPPLLARIRAGFPGRTQRVLGRHMTKDRRVIEVEIYAQQGLWNGRRAEFIQVRDITQLKRAEETLQNLSGRLLHLQDVLLRIDASRTENGELTPREYEILQLLAEGHTNKEIASALRISAYTAETHRRNIMQKLNLHSVAQLTRYAIRNQLLPP